MSALSSHMNVWNSCLLLLKEQGYNFWVEDIYDKGGNFEYSLWFAEKNGYKFCADNPIELLGLVAIYEFKKPVGEPVPYWWVIQGQNLAQEAQDKAIVVNNADED